MGLFGSFLFALWLPLAGIAPPDDLPITLDLENVESGELVRALAALANLELVLEPGVEARWKGRATLKLENASLSRALGAVSRATGLALRIEGDRLIVGPPARAAFAPPLPNDLRGEAIRLPPGLADKLRDSSTTSWASLPDDLMRAAPAPPVQVLVRRSGSEECYALSSGDGEASALAIALSAEPPETLLVIPLAYDPGRRARYVALETEPTRRRTLLEIVPGREATWSPGGAEITLVADADAPCGGRPAPFPATPGIAGLARVEVVRVRDGVRTAALGTCLVGEAGRATAYRGTHDPGKGQFRDDRLIGYVSRDAKEIALVLGVATAWTDPADGRVVFTTRFVSSTGFVPLSPEGIEVLRLSGDPAGGSLDARVYGETDRWLCATPRDRRTRISPAR